jgi:hypothetical protein
VSENELLDSGQWALVGAGLIREHTLCLQSHNDDYGVRGVSLALYRFCWGALIACSNGPIGAEVANARVLAW